MKRWFNLVSVSTAALLFSVGCEKEPGNKAAPAGKTEIVEKLAKADAVDGKIDKIVSKCAKCALRMDGDPQNTFEYSSYKLYFCSPGCRDNFAKDPEASTQQLAVAGS